MSSILFQDEKHVLNWGQVQLQTFQHPHLPPHPGLCNVCTMWFVLSCWNIHGCSWKSGRLVSDPGFSFGCWTVLFVFGLENTVSISFWFFSLFKKNWVSSVHFCQKHNLVTHCSEPSLHFSHPGEVNDLSGHLVKALPQKMVLGALESPFTHWNASKFFESLNFALYCRGWNI